MLRASCWPGGGGRWAAPSAWSGACGRRWRAGRGWGATGALGSGRGRRPWRARAARANVELGTEPAGGARRDHASATVPGAAGGGGGRAHPRGRRGSCAAAAAARRAGRVGAGVVFEPGAAVPRVRSSRRGRAGGARCTGGGSRRDPHRSGDLQCRYAVRAHPGAVRGYDEAITPGSAESAQGRDGDWIPRLDGSQPLSHGRHGAPRPLRGRASERASRTPGPRKGRARAPTRGPSPPARRRR